jgi:hypothetical protein
VRRVYGRLICDLTGREHPAKTPILWPGLRPVNSDAFATKEHPRWTGAARPHACLADPELCPSRGTPVRPLIRSTRRKLSALDNHRDVPPVRARNQPGFHAGRTDRRASQLSESVLLAPPRASWSLDPGAEPAVTRAPCSTSLGYGTLAGGGSQWSPLCAAAHRRCDLIDGSHLDDDYARSVPKSGQPRPPGSACGLSALRWASLVRCDDLGVPSRRRGSTALVTVRW